MNVGIPKPKTVMSSWWWLASPKITLLLKSDAFPMPFKPHWSNCQRSLQVDADFTFKDLPQMRIISGFVGFFSKPQIGRCHFGCHLFFCKTDGVWIWKKNYPPPFLTPFFFLVFAFKTTEDVLLLHQRVALCPRIFGPFAVGGLFSQSGSRETTGATSSKK